MAVQETSDRRLLPMGVPAAPRRRRRRPRHVAAVLAAVVYGGAAYGAWILTEPLWHEERTGGAAGVGTVAVAPPPALSESSRDLLAMRTLASRAQGGVYSLEAGNRVGSAFVAWVQAGKGQTFLMTARAVVAGVLADKGRDVYVKRDNRLWPARIVREDRAAGLVLVRVDTVLDRPLWQTRGRQARPAAGEPGFLVPAGPDAPFGEGTFAVRQDGDYELRTGAADLNVGAPVVAANGRIAGVVVRSTPRGVNRVVPIERACGKIRRCS